MTTYLIHREMSPLRQTDKYFSPRFFRIRENEEKKHLSKELLSCENSSVVFWQNEQKKKKSKKERKIPKQNLWILIDMKKTKTCSKTRKNKQQWYIIVWQTNFFAFCFVLKKWPPMAILFRPLWQIMIIITPFSPSKKMPPKFSMNFLQF